MKELEKTKRISIAAVITILVVIIALLTYKRPKHMYTTNAQQALELTIANNIVQLNDLKDEVLIDIRNQYEFEKGHLEKAININASDILLEDNKEVFETLKNEGKNIAFYGNTPSEAIAPLMILQQLGFNNLKILAVNNSLNQDKLVTTPAQIEPKGENINKFVAASVKKITELMKAKPKPKPVFKRTPTKKVVPKKKKKKMPIEGGC